MLYGNDDAFTQAGYGVMKAALDGLGVKILGTQTFAKPDRDYNAQLTALIGQKPDILVVSALAENAAGIVSQARQLGWQGPILGGNGFNSAQAPQERGPGRGGRSWSGPPGTAPARTPPTRPSSKLMASRSFEPDQFCAQAYTGLLVIAEAMKLAGKTGRDGVEAGSPR